MNTTTTMISGYAKTISKGGISEGLHNWSVSCADDAGNTAYSDTWFFTIDLSGPTAVELDDPDDGSVLSSNDLTFVWIPYDDSEPTLQCDYYLDSVLNESNITSFNGTNNSLNKTVQDGSHSWQVKCRDSVGNWASSQKWYFVVSSSPSVLNLVSPPNSSFWRNYTMQNNSGLPEHLNFTWYVADPNDASVLCNFSLDGVVNVSDIVSQNGTYTTIRVGPLDQGEHTWYVNCTNSLGTQIDSEEWVFTVDYVIINITLIHPATIPWPTFNTTSVDFLWYVEDNIDEELSCDMFLCTPGISPCGGGSNPWWLFMEDVPSPNGTIINKTGNGLVEEGFYAWIVFCEDDAGNYFMPNNGIRGFFIDLTPPSGNNTIEITLVDPPDGSNLNETTLNLSWYVEDNLDSVLTCSLYLDGSLNASNIASNNGSVTSYEVSGLDIGIHFWNVSCQDNGGNWGYSYTWNFTIDTTPPTGNGTSDITLIAPANNSTFNISNITFSWYVEDDMSDELTCLHILDNNSSTILPIPSQNGTVTSFMRENVSEGEHQWEVACVDDAGNWAYSETWQFLIDLGGTDDPEGDDINVTLLDPANDSAWNTPTLNLR
ncbi:MAG: Ig-like domain-containing protein, partial [Candidatus Anstonellales archaeon]